MRPAASLPSNAPVHIWDGIDTVLAARVSLGNRIA